MLRCLMRRFPLSLALYPMQTQLKFKLNHQKYILKQLQLHRQFHFENYMSHLIDIPDQTNPSAEAEPAAAGAIEGEYIVPYIKEHEYAVSLAVLTETLSKKLRLTKSEIMHITNDEIVKRACKERSPLLSIDVLIAKGVNKHSVVDYPWLITLDSASLTQKLELLDTMKIKNINHFVAFCRLTLARLSKLVISLKRESKIIPQSNRVYYISEVLDTDPYVVSKYLSRRLFILEMPFDQFDRNLHNMVEYKVPPLNVLRDLWAFRYTPQAVRLRLDRAAKAKKDKIMPWMVRCPEPILQHSFKLTRDELAVLGDKTSTVEYVAERLQFDVISTKSIMQKHPQVFQVRVTKIKEVLDYLLDEAGFTRFEIAQNPRILCHGLETTKKRIDELKSYGCRPSSLVIVCRSKREYDKFVQKWQSNRDRFISGTGGGDDVDDKKSETLEK